MTKKNETPSQRALRRINRWIRTNKSGKLYKAPGLSQAQLLVLLALAGVVDNEAPRVALTGRSRIGPTVQTLATITRLTRRWAGETLYWLSHPIADVDGQPLDLRGDSAPGGRVEHACEVVFYVPFILIAPGGMGGGRRNRVWLHPAFYEGTDEEFDMLEELHPWPYDPRLNGNSVPIQTGTSGNLEEELSSQKPEENNTAGAALPGDETTLALSTDAGGKSRLNVEGDNLARADDVEGPGSFFSPGSAAPAVLSPKKAADHDVHEICQPQVSARAQFEFLVTQLGLHGIDKFDLMAPDRVLVQKDDGTSDSKNKSFRWTYRGADGRRQNTKFGEQAAYDLDADQVLIEYDRSLPAILTDRADPKGNATLGRDFYWRGARGHEWPLIVLDDVTQIPPYRRFVSQTSASKFQVILLCDQALDEGDRHVLQSYYSGQKICDPGASGGIQPIRPPGSINRKPQRDGFVTRLVEVQLDAPLLCVSEIRQQLAAARPAVGTADAPIQGVAPSGILGRRRQGGVGGVRAVRTDHSPSADDLSQSMRMLKSGKSHHEVLDWLTSSAISRGKLHARQYAETTLKAAIYALAHDGQLPDTPHRAAMRAARRSSG